MKALWQRQFQYAVVGSKMVGWRKVAQDEPDFNDKYLVTTYVRPLPTFGWALDKLWAFDNESDAEAKRQSLTAGESSR